MWVRSGEITVALVMLSWYRSCGDTASGVVEVIESGPDIRGQLRSIYAPVHYLWVCVAEISRITGCCGGVEGTVSVRVEWSQSWGDQQSYRGVVNTDREVTYEN